MTSQNGTSTKREVFARVPESVYGRLEELRVWTGAPSISAMIAAQLELLLEDKEREDMKEKNLKKELT